MGVGVGRNENNLLINNIQHKGRNENKLYKDGTTTISRPVNIAGLQHWT